MDTKQFEALCDLYENRLRLLRNPTCARCEAKIRHPLAAWHVGGRYRNAERRLLFIGKPHRGTPGEIRKSGLLDPRKNVELLKDYAWAYWSYTREVATEVFGDREKGWESIALTNLVKCTSVSGDDSSVDQTSKEMVRSCLLELGVLSAEIELLKPTHLIFYTGKMFPELLSNMKIEDSSDWIEARQESIPCGKKRMLWWERRIKTSWGTVQALITGHPERMEKETFTRAIVQWALLPAN